MGYSPLPHRSRRRSRGLNSMALMYALLGVAALSALGAMGVLAATLFGGRSSASPSLAMQGTPQPTLVLPPPWDGKERINVLLLGVDDRPWDKSWGPPRSDTVILLTLDPASRTGGAISLPRDLWVDLPGIGERKLTQAYALGEAYYGAGQGALLTAQVVGKLLDVPVHHYVVVNFQAFIDFVNAIHGVKIDVPQRMALDVFTADGKRYDYPLYPGVQVLDGALALAYARNRSVGGDGDFGRMRRQQQVLEGVLQRLKDPRVLAELAVKAPLLMDRLRDSLHTDISVGDALKLARLAAEIPRQNIHLAIVDQREATATFKWENGVQVYALVPDREKLLAVRDRVFSPQPEPTPTPAPLTPTPAASPSEAPGAVAASSPTPPPSAPAAVLDEHARLQVANGTAVNGLACRTARWLQAQGFPAVEATNADGRYAQTALVVYTPKPQTVAFLQDLFGVDASRVRYRAASSPQTDVVIVLGDDWARSGRVAGLSCSP